MWPCCEPAGPQSVRQRGQTHWIIQMSGPCVFCVYVCGWSYKIVKHPPSPPISSHKDKYTHKDFGEVTCVWQLNLSVCWCVWQSLTKQMTHGALITSPFVLSLFFTLRFSFFICHKLFSPAPLWPHTPSCLSLTPQPSSLYSVILFSFPSPDILPGSIAETSDLSRGTHGQHPCLLFSLFLLSSLPSFIHLSPFFPPPFCLFSSITCSPRKLFSQWFPRLFLPLLR